MMKRICIMFIFSGIPLLCGCTDKPHAAIAENSSQPIYLKEHVTDRQMIRDLNVCANEVFQGSLDSKQSDRNSEKEAQKECMRTKGYEIVYK